VHDKAWQEMFDAFLRERAERTGEQSVGFDPVADYAEYVDGKPRADGVRDFLASRGILPEGNRDDSPRVESVNGLANRKNEALLQRRRRRGLPRLPAVPGGSPGSRLAPRSGLLERKHRGGPPGHGAGPPGGGLDRRHRDCRSGAERQAGTGLAAGRAGGFGFVVGVDRSGQADAMREHGADIVVSDLAQLLDGAEGKAAR
jgi:beta-phosphoglucomutase-like phosphatase (HAD superfamily)